MVYDVVVSNTTSNGIVNWGDNYWWHNCWSGCTCNTYTYKWTYPITTTVYKYQIICPAKGCGTSNWLELDVITPCTKCGAKLKAVSEKVDYEVPVTP